ncbi:hypothetical protein pipiens_002624 [Culex pipiens pipiens]|uniref:Uncharacterized protein n=1 Tax=Culex pipiens pipiens TaxID=38569 RepID=A0ABD1DAP0_CULPP
MGSTLLVVSSLATTALLLLLSVATPAQAGLIQAPELTELCDGQPCLRDRIRRRKVLRQGAPPVDAAAAPAPPADTAAAPPADGAPAPAPAAPAGGPPAEGGAAAAAPIAGLSDIPLPPVTQQMPNLPKNFPYPDVKVVQEVPIPTKPRKKLIPGGANPNPYPFPSIGPVDPPPFEPVPTSPIEPASPVEPEPEPPVAPIEPSVPLEPSYPIEKEPYPVPAKPDCNPVAAVGGYGPPQDWRFPKARGHKKCPPSAVQPNSVMSNEVNPVVGYDAGNDVVQAQPEDVSVNLRTVQRDDEAGGDHHTTLHPAKGSAMSVACSMGRCCLPRWLTF